MKNTLNLNESEREEFIAEFYSIPGNPLNEADDGESSSPWGAPWTWGKEVKGRTIADMAQKLWDSCKVEILQVIKEDEENRQCETYGK